MRLLFFCLLILASACSPEHQSPDGHEAHHDHPGEPRAERSAPALHATLDTDGLLEGRGMGLARPAETNHYPGPMHVLELAARLDLSDEQTAQTQALMDEVKANARRLGRQIVDAEAELDRLFSDGTPTPEQVRLITRRIAELNGALRAAHLNAHLAQRDMLTPEQVATYDQLRGHKPHG
jgi:Spy/CpxP family protein refolding chaperone